MNRRKGAFQRLCGSLFIAICALSSREIAANPAVAVPLLGLLAAVLLSLVASTNRVLDKQAFAEVRLAGGQLERLFRDSSEEWRLADIRSVHIKRTARGPVREVRMGLSSRGFRYVNGLEQMEAFVDDLLSSSGSVKVTESKEPIDFDNPLYYVFLGAALGVVATLLLRMIPLLGAEGAGLYELLIGCFTCVAGGAMLLSRPIMGRFGKASAAADVACGSAFIVIGMLIIVYSRSL